MKTIDFYNTNVKTIEGKDIQDSNQEPLSYAECCKLALLQSQYTNQPKREPGDKEAAWKLAKAIQEKNFKFEKPIHESHLKLMYYSIESMWPVDIAGQVNAELTKLK
jgi:hypothetical protein